MTKLEDLTDEAVQSAAMQLAAIGGHVIPTATDRETLEPLAQDFLTELSSTWSITISTDGDVSHEPLPAAPAPSESRIVHTPSEARVSPGIARMRARLGSEGTELLREQVVGDGDVALKIAAERPVLPAEGHDWVAPAPAPEMPLRDMQITGAMALRLLTTVELNKRLSKELDPKSRDVIKEAIKVASARESGETKKATSAPAPRRVSAERSSAPGASDTIRITVPNGTNPKRADAARRFDCYKDGMTVADYIAAIGGDAAKAARDITWDTSKGWIKIEAAAS